MVVLIHIFQKLQKYYSNLGWISDWLNIGLVFFFVISAFLYSNRQISKSRFNWFFHRYLDLTLPSLLTAVAAVLMFQFFYKNITVPKLFIALFSGLGAEAFLSDGWIFVQYWFITYILVCYATVPLIQKIDFKALKEVQFWCGLAFVSVVMQGTLSLFGKLTGIPSLSWGVLLRFYLPYALFKRYDKFTIKRPMRSLSIFAVFCVSAVCVLRYVIVPNGVLAAISELAFIYTQTLVGTVMFYWLYEILAKVQENTKLIKMTDSYSYPIYLTHCLFIGYSTSIINKFDNHAIGVLMALACTVVASVFVKLVLMPICRRIEKCVIKN